VKIPASRGALLVRSPFLYPGAARPAPTSFVAARREIWNFALDTLSVQRAITELPSCDPAHPAGSEARVSKCFLSHADAMRSLRGSVAARHTPTFRGDAGARSLTCAADPRSSVRFLHCFLYPSRLDLRWTGRAKSSE